MSRLSPGKRYRVTFEGTATNSGALRFDGADDLTRGSLAPSAAIRHAVEVEEILPRAPKWQPGDVVVVRFDRTGTPFTYVRGLHGWPGEFRASKSDGEMDRLYAEGKAEPVLQAGGVPFAATRIPSSAPRPVSFDEFALYRRPRPGGRR